MWIFITYFSFLPHYNVFWKHGLPRNLGIWLLFRGPEHSNWIHYSGFWSLGAIHWLEERDWRLLKGLLGQVGASVWTKPWTTKSVGPSDTSIKFGGVPQESSNLNSMIPVSWEKNRESKKWKKLIHSLNQSLPYHHLKCAEHSTRPWGVRKKMAGGVSNKEANENILIIIVWCVHEKNVESEWLAASPPLSVGSLCHIILQSSTYTHRHWPVWVLL